MVRESSSFPPESGPVRSQIAVLRSLLPFLWPAHDVEIKIRVTGALVCIGLAKAANVVVPILFGWTVDTLGGVESVIYVPLGLILGYGLARFLSLGFQQIRDAVFAKVGVRAVRKSALAVLEHLHRLSLRFHLERQTGAISRSIERGTIAIQSLLSITLFNILPTLFEVGLVTIILWRSFDGWFALVTLSTVIIYIIFTALTTEWRMPFRREMNVLDNQANTRAVDSLLNYETVKSFGNEVLEADEYDRVMGQYEVAAVKSQVSLAIMNTGQAAIIASGVTTLMLMAGFSISNGQMTVGGFVMVNTYMFQLAQPLNFFGFVYRNIKQALVDLEKMFDLLEEVPEVHDVPGASPLTVSRGHIRFENISFSYDTRRPILRDVSFEVPSGKTIALVGQTGSGKSTIGRLLFRLYDVTKGRITIDGQDIKARTQESVRANIGIVPQDTVLFNNSIRYNLAYAKPSASQAEIEDAADLAHIHRFISNLPDGYDTVVGERGLKLSGGEKQRVAIARVILKQAPILMFDEATSALDTHTEKEIQSNLREVSENRTTLVIAHRLSTVIDVDEILVMNEGKIVESGPHDDLIALNGLYAALWEKQQWTAAFMEDSGEGSSDLLNLNRTK